VAEHTPLHEQTAAAGAVFDEEAGWLIPAHFGDPVGEYNHARGGAVLVDRSSRGKVEVRGADAARFLHNLATNEIVRLAPGEGCEAFLTTNKAKVIAYLLIFRDDSAANPPAFWLDTTPGMDDRIMQHLDRYLISEQVEFANRTREYAQMHLAGPQAEGVLRQLVAEALPPAEPLRHVSADLGGGSRGPIRRHDALGLPGYDILCPANEAANVWQRLIQAGAQPAGREACEILRIEAGLPCEGADIDENTFAPEVGRIAQTISYAKGCYLGQESIVMARDRGQVNRSLVGVKLPQGPVPRGSLLFAQGKEVGRVTSSVLSPRLGSAIGLAYVRRGHQEPGTALEVKAGGSRSPAEVIRLPLAADDTSPPTAARS
jgi:folate-binding protein YgfZ